MDTNPFFDKFENKSNSELFKIAASKEDYQLKARFTAVKILTSRGEESDFEASILSEHKEFEYETAEEVFDIKERSQNIIVRLKKIPVRETRIWLFGYGNQLEVKRLNQTRFQVRIEDNYRSFIAPVMISEIKNDDKLFTYPFLYLRSFIFAAATSLVLAFLHFLNIFTFEHWLLAVLLPIGITFAVQLVLAPLMYYIVKDRFLELVGGKN